MRRGRHATRRASQQPSLHMTTMIGDETSCARGPRVQVLPTSCFYLEGVLDFCSRCTFPGGESRGHVDGSGNVRMPARRQYDGRWECLVKPANCYRFIGTHGVHVPERKEDHREGSSVTADVITGLRETEWTISDYGNSRRLFITSPFIMHRCAHTRRESRDHDEETKELITRINYLKISGDKQDVLVEKSIYSAVKALFFLLSAASRKEFKR